MDSLKTIYPIYQENWNFYLTIVAKEKCTVRTDLNLEKIAPIKDYPVITIIKIRNIDLKNYREISNIETKVDIQLSKAIKVGVITFKDEIHLIYYQDSKRENHLEYTLKNNQFQEMQEDDPNWNTYNQILKPDKYDKEQIKDRQRLRYYKEDQEEKVQFIIYYKDEDKIEQFIKQVKMKDLNFIDLKLEKHKGDYKKLTLIKNMPLNLNNITNTTYQLLDIADKNQVIYDKWQTETDPILEKYQYKNALVSNRIMKDNQKVGYCCKMVPKDPNESGWTFFSGDEDEIYSLDPNNFDNYKIEEIVKIDPEIIQILDSKDNISYQKDQNGRFQKVNIE